MTPIDRRRRRHVRYRSNFPVTVSHLDGNQYKKFEGHCSDLSECGMGMLLATDMKNDEVVELQFVPPGSKTQWELRAVVRYRRGYHYGFEFLSLSNEQREGLRSSISGLEALD